MKETIIFTDGASSGNPGPGGWGAIIVGRTNEIIKELGGGEKNTTNNRMEMKAAVEALSNVDANEVTLFTDSGYLVNGATKWIHGWKMNGWKTKTKEDVVNKDLWLELDQALSKVKVEWKQIGGHIGIIGNERCDEIATAYALGKDVSLYDGPLSQYSIKNILDVSHDDSLLSNKKSSGDRSGKKAFSYISKVDGKILKHATWVECEARVKGVKGARFKKSLDALDEAKIIREFQNL